MQFNRDQFDRLAQGALGAFVRRLRGHVRACFPQQCEELTDPQLDAICLDGVRRAEEYGIRSQREVCKFVDLMFVLGSDFDHRAAWVATALRDTGVAADERVTRLVQTTMAAMR